MSDETIRSMISVKNFCDWHSDVFGFGYGSGEEYWIPALHAFFTRFAVESENGAYNHVMIEDAIGPLAAWLLINTLCMNGIIEYGTSPRYGWLTKRGRMLREFVAARTAEDLGGVVDEFPDANHCLPDWCNCENREGTCNPLYGTDR